MGYSSYHVDTDNIGKGIRLLVEDNGEAVIHVCRADVVVDGLTLDEMRERNVLNRVDEVCTISIDSERSSEDLWFVHVKFHENALEEQFYFRKSGGDWASLKELSPVLGAVEDVFEKVYDIPTFDFASVDSGSLSGGFHDGLADREFVYEQVVKPEQLRR